MGEKQDKMQKTYIIKIGHPHRWNNRESGRTEAETFIRFRHPEQKKMGVYTTVPTKKRAGQVQSLIKT